MKPKNKIILVIIVLAVVSVFAAEKQKTIFEAINKGDISEVKRMASTTKNLDIKNEQGRTPLMLAAEQANMECEKALVDAGADINATDKGFTVIDQLESMLRRIKFNAPEFKQKRIEQMRREGFSEDVIRKDIQMLEASTPRLNGANDVQKLQEMHGRAFRMEMAQK